MRKTGGYLVTTYDDGRKVERDTATCVHCNRVFIVGVRVRVEDIGGMCSVCKGVICPQCLGKGCDEVQRKLDRAEAAYHARRSYGLCD